MMRRIALLAALGAGLAITAAAPAGLAATTQPGNGTLVDAAPAALTCVSTTGAEACFEPLGDKFYVKDTSVDSHHAAMYGVVNGVGYRCHNYLGGGKWAVCDGWYDSIPEHATIAFRAERMEGSTILNHSGWAYASTT